MRIIHTALVAVIALTTAQAPDLSFAKDRPSLSKRLILKKAPGGTAAKSLAPGTSSSAIPYPNCPNGTQLRQRGAHIFTCRVTTIGMYVNQNVDYLNTFDCNPTSYWQQQATVTYWDAPDNTAQGPDLWIVQWKCLKN